MAELHLATSRVGRRPSASRASGLLSQCNLQPAMNALKAARGKPAPARAAAQAALKAAVEQCQPLYISAQVDLQVDHPALVLPVLPLHGSSSGKFADAGLSAGGDAEDGGDADAETEGEADADDGGEAGSQAAAAAEAAFALSSGLEDMQGLLAALVAAGEADEVGKGVLEQCADVEVAALLGC